MHKKEDMGCIEIIPQELSILPFDWHAYTHTHTHTHTHTQLSLPDYAIHDLKHLTLD